MRTFPFFIGRYVRQRVFTNEVGCASVARMRQTWLPSADWGGVLKFSQLFSQRVALRAHVRLLAHITHDPPPLNTIAQVPGQKDTVDDIARLEQYFQDKANNEIDPDKQYAGGSAFFGFKKAQRDRMLSLRDILGTCFLFISYYFLLTVYIYISPSSVFLVFLNICISSHSITNPIPPHLLISSSPYLLISLFPYFLGLQTFAMTRRQRL